MPLKMMTACFALSLLGSAAYAQSNRPVTPPEAVRSTADGATNPECVSNPNIPDATAAANAKCMVARKTDVGKLGPMNGNTIVGPGARPGPIAPR